MPSASKGRPAPAFFQRAGHIGSRTQQRRRDPRQNSAGHRNPQRKQKRARIQSDRSPAADKLRHFRRHVRQDHVNVPLRQEKPQHRAADRQQNALDQQLPHHPPPAAAQSRANREFADPPGHPRELHVGHVGASDQQHESHRREQHQGVFPRQIARYVIAQLHRHGLKSAVGVGIRRGLLCRDRLHLGRRFLERNAGRQTSLHPQPAVVTPRTFFHVERKRNPRLRRQRVIKTLVHHADHGERLAVHLHVFSENVSGPKRNAVPKAHAPE